MEVILLERVVKLGQMGDVVRVKDGFARNYLLRKGKALRATKENRSRFEHMKVELEARNLEQKTEAEKDAEALTRLLSRIRKAAEEGDTARVEAFDNAITSILPDAIAAAYAEVSAQ